MKKVLIVSSGYSPVPVSKGGAVESLIEYVVRENEKKKEMELFVSSSFDDQALKLSKKYSRTRFYFVKIPKIIHFFDSLVCFFFTKILKKKKTIRYLCIIQRLYYVSKVKKILKINNFDSVVLENHVLLLRLFKNRKLRKKYDGKYFYHEHNVISSTAGCDSVLCNSKRILTVSNYITEMFSKRYPNFDKNKIVKLPNVADLTRFRNPSISSEEIRSKLGISRDDFCVLFAGRLDQTKGVLEVIKAFEIINQKHIKLVIVGSYNYGSGQHNAFEEELHRRTVNLGDKVIFTGFISFYDMPSVYHMANLIVLPSIWDDPAPLTIIEALSSGKALITTYSGGIPEYASGAAILLKRDDNLVDNIRYHILNFFNHSDLIDKYEQLAIEKTNDWTIEKYYTNFIDILD